MLPAMKTFGELLHYCRAGFEGECAQEIAAAAPIEAARGSAYVVTRLPAALDAAAVDALADWRRAIFARQRLPVFVHLTGLPRADRLGPILAALRERGEHYHDAWVEAPDSDEGKALAAFCRSFGNALIGALKKERLLDAQAPGRSPSASEAMDGRKRPPGRSPSATGRSPSVPKAMDGREGPSKAMDGRERPPRRLHAFFPQGDNVYLASADSTASAPWPQGIPRLKFPREAPSRSTLKLEEALLVLLGDDERERWLKPGMAAVDLGASPGGWTWQLVRRSLRVTAVDNGPMDGGLMQSGLVTHLRADGFRFQPKKAVDWMVCDMVEQPRRVADLVARWLGEGWCRRAIFNLKLPMKKRYEETRLCLKLIEDQLAARGQRAELRARQLYHDREEITVFARVLG
jgi:23S rRNA (cytidine2498-2'-O)-methyltransferase